MTEEEMREWAKIVVVEKLGRDPVLTAMFRDHATSAIAAALPHIREALAQQQDSVDLLTIGSEESRRRWPPTGKPNADMSPLDWLNEGQGIGFALGAQWAGHYAARIVRGEA